MAMAARRPAAPPPTIRTSCAARMTPSLTAPLLVGEHVPVVVDHKTVAAAVVELFPAASAPAGELEFLGDQPLMVLGQELVAAVPVPARGEPRLKSGSGCAHGPPPFGAGTVTSDLRAEPAPHSRDWEGLPASWWSHARAWGWCTSSRRPGERPDRGQDDGGATRRARTASANSASIVAVMSRSTHASVTLLPYSRAPGRCWSRSWRPATRLLSSITPRIACSPPASWPARSCTTSSWRRWFFWLLPCEASTTTTSGRPRCRSLARVPAMWAAE